MYFIIHFFPNIWRPETPIVIFFFFTFFKNIVKLNAIFTEWWSCLIVCEISFSAVYFQNNKNKRMLESKETVPRIRRKPSWGIYKIAYSLFSFLILSTTVHVYTYIIYIYIRKHWNKVAFVFLHSSHKKKKWYTYTSGQDFHIR